MRHQRVRGQATVEFVVACLVLVPLFVAIPLVAKYLDVMQTAEVAARYVAFEGINRNSASSWKSDGDLSMEVRRRFFSNSDAAIKTGDAAGDFAAHRNPMWTDSAGHPLIERFEDRVKVTTAVSDKNAIAASKLFGDAMNLSTNNWYDAKVQVSLADVPNFQPFDSIGLTTSRGTQLLADAWTARDNAMIRGRIKGSALTYPLGLVEPLVDALGMAPILIYDPALVLGNHDWDIVPCDRLEGGC